MTNAISDITNLKFYTANGQELYMLKLYVMTWELIVNDASQMSRVLEAPSGYFLGDVSITPNTTNPLNSLTEIVNLEAGFTNPGRIVIPTEYDTSGNVVDPTTDDCYVTLYELLLSKDNYVKVSLNILGNSYTNLFSSRTIFKLEGDTSTYADYVDLHKIYVGDNVDSSEYYNELSFKKIDIKKTYSGVSILTSNFNKQVANLGKYFPFVRYYGDFTQQKVSTNLQAVDTILVLEKDGQTYRRPSLYSSTENSYSMLFEPLDPNGELTLIESDNAEITVVPSVSFSMNDEIETADPFAFAVSVCSDTEGAYQNMLTMKIVDFASQMEFYLGAINVKTEIEGEDARFRTLMENFGVPDPKEYLNIFSDAEYSEVNKDNILLNQKSKEMFLTYSDIFSYVGTYKALFKAVRYLGYSDIIFKEWYRVIDLNDQQKELAVLVIDIENNKFLELKLASYGISIEDFLKYNKLNKISMIYQMNEYDDDTLEILDISVYDTSSQTYISSKLYLDTQLTKPIYVYRNTEILAKLQSVKKWLEKYIIGVSAYISDVTGEGIYIGSIKTLTYNNNGLVYDFTTEQYHTPSSKQKSKFIDSSAIVQCTLAELHDNLTFEDYEYTPIQQFIRHNQAINMQTNSSVKLDIDFNNSNTIEAPVLADEYAFELINNTDTGTLYEWSGSDQQIFVTNNRMKLLFNEIGDASIASDKLPIILLEYANIHAMYGRWSENTVWTINELYDSSTGEVIYNCKNTTAAQQKNTFYATSHTQVILKPSSTASIRYSEQNKWQIPVLIIKGYDFASLTVSDSTKTAAYKMDPNSEYVLEIVRGDLMFKKVNNVGVSVMYSQDDELNPYTSLNLGDRRQYLKLAYTYYSDKLPYTLINDSSIVAELSTVYDYTADTSAIVNAHNVETIGQMTRFKDKVNAVGDANNAAAIEASTFIDSSFNDTEFITKYSNLYEQKKLYDAYRASYESNYICNSSIDVSVTRIGEYDTYVKSYDRYNNIYVETTSRKTKVQALPISINTYVSHSNSSNNENFYKSNRNGIELDSSTLVQLIIDSSARTPLFPKSYRAYDTDFDQENKVLRFDNINYAIDTPMMKDQMIFENLSELCTDAFSDNSSTRIYMLDENPRDVIFNIGDNFEICIYDNILQKDIAYYGPYPIKDMYFTDASTNMAIADESYVEIDPLDSTETRELYDYMNDPLNRYKAFAFNNTEYEIKAENIYEDASTGNHCITIDSNLHFNAGDVVKVRTRYDESLVNLSSSTLINEAAYRLDSVTYDTDINAYMYLLNGRLNLNNFGQDSMDSFGSNGIDASSMKTYIMYAHQKMVRYHTILPDDAYEDMKYVGYNENVPLLQEVCTIDTDFNMVGDYIDNNYSITVYDYDNDSLNRIWLDTSVIDASTETMYGYTDFPVSIDQNDYVIFEGVDTYGTLKPGFKTSWKTTGLLLNDDKNLNLYVYNAEKETLYRSENKYLTVRPLVLGAQDIELTFTDIYGNVVVNNGEGKIYVRG